MTLNKNIEEHVDNLFHDVQETMERLDARIGRMGVVLNDYFTHQGKYIPEIMSREAFEAHRAGVTLGWNSAIQEMRDMVEQGKGQELLTLLEDKFFSFPAPVFEITDTEVDALSKKQVQMRYHGKEQS